MNDLYIYTDGADNTIIATQPPLTDLDGQEEIPGINKMIAEAITARRAPLRPADE